MNPAGMFILGVCAAGGVIACAAFWWAIRSGQFSDASDARYLVFDDEDDVARPAVERREDTP